MFLKFLPFFIIGFNSQIFQIILIRETFTVFYSSELAFAILLGIWLLWTGLGSITASLFTRSRIKPVYLFIFTTFIVSVVIFLEIYYMRGMREFFNVSKGEPLPLSGLITASVIILYPVCFFVGAQFLFASMLSKNPKLVYIVECLGAGVAGLLLSTPILEITNHFILISICFFINMFFCMYLLYSENLMKKAVFFITLLVPLIITVVLISFSKKLDISLREKFFVHLMKSEEFELVECVDSKYGNISVIKYRDDFTLYQSGKQLFSLPDRVRDYAAFATVSMLQHRNPRNVLLIGGGASGLLKEILKFSPENVDYIEIDPKVLTVSVKYASTEDVESLNSKSVNKIFSDGRRFINNTKKKYDEIIILTSEPTSALANRFFTREFIVSVKNRLQSNGVLILGSLTSYDIGFDELILKRNRCLYFTLRENFKNVIATPGKSLYFISSDSDYVSLESEEVYKRIVERNVYNVDVSFLLQEDQRKKINYELKTGLLYDPFEEGAVQESGIKEEEKNSDIKPAAFYDSTLIWLDLYNKDFLEVVKNLRGFSYWKSIIPFLIFFVVLIFLRKTACRKVGAMFICFSVSVIGISLEILLINAYQYSYGYVYSTVGILFSMFMFGLSFGAMFSEKIFRGGFLKSAFLLLVALCLTTLLFLFSSSYIHRFADLWKLVYFFSLMLLLGFLVGAVFPIVIRLWKSEEQSVSGAGILYGVDIIGGCVGSFVLGAVVLPIYGYIYLLNTSLFLAMFALLVLLILFFKK